MIGEKGFRALAERVMALAGADQTEVLVQAGDSALTRFANSEIHQNVSETTVTVRVRVVTGKRTGVASTTDPSEAGLQKVVASALEAARFQPANPDLPSMPGPAGLPAVQSFSEATARCDPAERARIAGVFCDKARAKGLTAAGAISTRADELGVANSLGLLAYGQGTSAEVSTVIMGTDSSGWSEQAAIDVRALDVERVSDEAVSLAERGRNPRPLPAGRYPVILTPYAVHDIANMLAFLGFSALAVQEKRSFMAGKLGQAVMSPLISISDDPLDPEGVPSSFDFEGVPRQKVDLIRGGVASGLVYDTETAAREGRSSTGHALPAPNSEGPFALHLHLYPGGASLADMIRGMDRGLLVTRFHYTRPVHPSRVIVTGMTRDGTFWVEKGEIAYPVKNLRFTQSYVDALGTVNAVGNEMLTLAGMVGIGATRVPALSLPEWEFTGVTEF